MRFSRVQSSHYSGERFDHTQSNEARRQFDNLMLMCHDHHVVTNDVAAYPAERLRQMKADYERQFETGLASMMRSNSVQITNSTVSLGGEGGKSLGAGGGGGGAIGPGAIGGSGGQGGEIKESTIAIEEEMVAIRVHISRAGEGGINGNAGSDGENSFVEAVRRDGSVKELLRAKGGKGGDLGPGSVQIGTALLANYGEVRDGMLFISAGGWSSYTVESVLYPLIFSVLYIAEPHAAPYGTVTTKLIDPAGVVITSHEQSFDFFNGNVPFAINFCVPLTDPAALGTWYVVFTCAERELRRLPFEVRLS